MYFCTFPKKNVVGKKACKNNSRDRNDIICVLTNFESVKLIQCETIKEMWTKLHAIYKEMRRLRKQSFKLVEHNLKASR